MSSQMVKQSREAIEVVSRPVERLYVNPISSRPNSLQRVRQQKEPYLCLV
jgi:hypothetical protein